MVKVKEDLTGRRFGKLVVLEQAEDHVCSSGRHDAMWLCECDCGKQTCALGRDLKRGATRSCGCYNIETARRKIRGVGIFDGDVGDGQTISNPIYVTWKHMLERCYNHQAREHVTYINTTVCDDWLYYSNFKTWYLQNNWYTGDEIINLDKDILIKGNQQYGPMACVLVPHSLNMLFVTKRGSRGKYPIGVTRTSSNKRFTARFSMSHNVIYIGCFDTPEEAFQAYKKAKEQHIKDVADEYKAKYPDFPQKLYDAMYAYEVEITD